MDLMPRLGKAGWCGLLALLLAAAPVPVRAASASQTMERAMKLYEKGAYDDALKAFVKVLRSEPDNVQAREYMMRCSQKIVETKLGTQAAETVEQEINVQKIVREDILPTVSTYTPVFHAPEPAPAPVAVEAPAISGEDIKSLGLAPPEPRTAKALLQQRNTLTDEFRRRYLGRGETVEIDERGGRLEVTFYLHRLFHPFSDVLRRDAYAHLNDVLNRIHADPQRKVVFNAVDNVSPAVRHTMADLASRRCSAVFTYLLYLTSLPEKAGS